MRKGNADMSKNVNEVVVKVPQGTKQVTIKIEPAGPVQEDQTRQRRKICD